MQKTQCLRCLKAAASSIRGEVLRITNALNALGSLKNRLDDTMFEDHPELSRKWVRLYYGTQEEADALIPDRDGSDS